MNRYKYFTLMANLIAYTSCEIHILEDFSMYQPYIFKSCMLLWYYHKGFWDIVCPHAVYLNEGIKETNRPSACFLKPTDFQDCVNEEECVKYNIHLSFSSFHSIVYPCI